jgi:hypothetical protein
MRRIVGNTDREAFVLCRIYRDASGGARLVVITAMLTAMLITECWGRRNISGAVRFVVIVARMIDTLRNARGADGIIRMVAWVSTMIREARSVVYVHALVARTRHICVDEKRGQRRRKNRDGGSNVPSEARWELEEQNAS